MGRGVGSGQLNPGILSSIIGPMGPELGWRLTGRGLRSRLASRTKVITSSYRVISIRLIILTFLLELRSGLRLKRKAPDTGGEFPLAEDPRSPPLSAGYPRFSSHRSDLQFRIWRQRPEGPVQALWPRHCAARMSDPGPPAPVNRWTLRTLWTPDRETLL